MPTLFAGCEVDSRAESPASAAVAGHSGHFDGTAAPMALVGDHGYEWPTDCDAHYVFRAHAQPDAADATPYTVPAGSQYYASFLFLPPWAADEVQGLKFRALIDNPKVVHHWILYGSTDAHVQDGAVLGTPNQRFPYSLPGEAFIQGWAPGGDDLAMPDNVGLHMPNGATSALRLELHYNNSGAIDEQDASGVELCVTRKLRPQEAAVHWLGTPRFSVPAHAARDVVSTCQPQVTQAPVHLMSMAPHMHRLGVGAKAILHRASGTSETLLDVPFAFDDQRTHRLPVDGSAAEVLLYQGDSITTTCLFNNQSNAAISFGPNTEDEMCFFFVLAWPRGQLANGRTSFIPGAEPSVNCLQ